MINQPRADDASIWAFPDRKDDIEPVDGEQPFDDLFDDDDEEDDEDDDLAAEEDGGDEKDDREMTGETGSEGGGAGDVRVPGPAGRYPRG